MRNTISIILCLSFVALIMGCQGSQTRAGEGALVGGLIGATAGGIIGHQSHHGAEGAAIGAGVGAITGAILGSQIEKQPGQQPSQTSVAGAPGAYNPNQMTIQQIVDLTKQGINEAVIIDKIRITNSKFNLTQADIEYLKQQGVSQNVINVMQGL